MVLFSVHLAQGNHSQATQANLSACMHGNKDVPCAQALVLCLCALGPRELSTVRLGPLTPHAVRTLRHLRDFLGVTFNVAPDAASQTVFLSCVGAGIKSLARRAG